MTRIIRELRSNGGFGDDVIKNARALELLVFLTKFFAKKTVITKIQYAAAEINAIDNEQGFIADKIDDMDEEIEVIGNEVFDEFYDDEDDDDEEFSIRCQACGEDICVTHDDLMEGEVVCPNCGTEIEFDFDCGDDCDDCE